MYYVTHVLLIKKQNQIVHHTLTNESLENVRVELLNNVRQRNSEMVKPGGLHSCQLDEVNTCLPFPLFLLCNFSVQLLKFKV